eukprot:SAG31_NODE_1601_length_7786_cov_33.553272_9_plen_87_part_00
MDALTFGSKKMLRHLHKSEAQKLPILEIDLSIALKELGMTVRSIVSSTVGCANGAAERLSPYHFRLASAGCSKMILRQRRSGATLT